MRATLPTTLALVLAAALAPAPARADVLGSIINEVMQALLFDAPPERDAEPDTRGIPADAKKGRMEPPRGRLVEIGGTRHRMSPGCQIRDLDNRIVLPSHIDEPIDVRYALDSHTQIRRIWLMAKR